MILMFDVITLAIIQEIVNKNQERIEEETMMTVQAVPQSVSRQQRNLYGERGMGRALRFKISLLGDYYQEDIPYFYHRNIKYATQDLIKDVTGSSYFIEGATVRGTRGTV